MENNLAVIQKLIQEIESYTNTYNSVSEIPSIEKDILLQKIREMYDLLIQPNQQTEIQNGIVEEPIIETPTEEIKTQEEESPDYQEDKDAKIAELEARLAELTQKDFVANNIEVTIDEQTEKQQISEENKPHAEIPEPENVAVEPEKENSPKQVVDLASKLGKTPITDIYSAIRFNDRVRYRANLFNKDQEYFLREVNKLNEMKSYDEALQYLQNTYSWDFENSSDVKEFLSYVERRFL